jgi:hypothetical protein
MAGKEKSSWDGADGKDAIRSCFGWGEEVSFAHHKDTQGRGAWTTRRPMMNTPASAARAIRQGVGAARTKAGVLASIRALPTLPRSKHAAKTFLSLLTNMTVFRLPLPPSRALDPGSAPQRRPRPAAARRAV